MAGLGPRITVSSGFGGLGFEGMVGMEDPVGETISPPGEGKRGAMSGDTSENGESGGSGSNAGAAEIAGVSTNFSSGEKESEEEAMKAVMSATRNQKGAIQMMREIKNRNKLASWRV
ncbi:hypothetical protein NMG60_11021728 [Bertholletia excelsa]